MKPIPRVGEQEFRLPEQGRIRFGVKHPQKKYPVSLNTFRFTSPDRTAIEQIAQQFGGEARPWVEPKAQQKNQWEVITTSDQIDVWVPPGGLSVGYELWGGSGRDRFCDGEECVITLYGDQGPEDRVQPCICAAQNRLDCKPKVRLTVVLPQIPFGGGWRLESGSWAAFHEMPTMEQMLQALQQQGMVQATLRLVERTKVVKKKNGQAETRRWKVPVLGLSATPMQIVAGQASVAALTAAQVETPVALPAPRVEVVTNDPDAERAAYYDDPANRVITDEQWAQRRRVRPPRVELDDDVIDAEVVEEESWATREEIPLEIQMQGIRKENGRWVRKS